VQVGDYDMYNIILDMGSDVNIILRKTWEMMGKPNLTRSPIQLRLANQHKIVPIGRLTHVNVNINGVCNIADFKVITIVDGRKPYLYFIIHDLDFDNQTIIDLKKRQMIFEVEYLRVIAPLDPTKGR
jgi:hypothetical protein